MKTLLVLALAAGSAGMAAGAQNPTFRAAASAVRVDVLVTKGGKPVTGLGPADFTVDDNGVAQDVSVVSIDQIPLNVVLALDMSDSVAGKRLDELRAASRAVVKALRPGDHAGLVSFASTVSLDVALTSETTAVDAALAARPGSGDTALVDACYAAMAVGQGDAGRALVIVFSDGSDTASFLSPGAVLKTAKRMDDVVYAVTTTGERRETFLHDLTSATGGRLLDVTSTKDLGARLLSILDEFRHRYVLTYTPKGVSSGGWHDLRVQVRVRDAVVNARPGYLAAETDATH